MTGSELGTVGLLVIFPVLSAIAGAAWAVLRPPGVRLTSAVQYFAAGAVLAVVALDLLPGLRQQGHLGSAIVGFVLGAAILLGLQLSEAHGGDAAHDQRAAGLPVSLLVAVGVDLFIDGILVGGSVATLGRAQGVALTIALTLVILPLAVAVTIELSGRGFGALQAALVPPLLSLALVVGAIGAVVSLGGAPAVLLSVLFAFGVAALLFLATEELLLEAHQIADTRLLAVMLFIGFFALYIVDASG